MSNTNNNAKATSKATTFEDKIRKYASLFDGNKKDFSGAIESMFNDLYHDDYQGTVSNGVELSREARKQLDVERLASGVKVTNVEYTRIGLNKALVEFHLDLESEGHNVIAQNLVTIKDKKIIEARHVYRFSGIIKARWLSDYHSLRRIQSYQHVDKLVFEGRTSPFADGDKGNASLVAERPRPLYPTSAVLVVN